MAFAKFQELYGSPDADTTHIFTDGSHHDDPGLPSAAFVIPSLAKSEAWRLARHSGILSGELYAISSAHDFSINNIDSPLIRIFSDSQAALTCITNAKPSPHPVVYDIRRLVENFRSAGTLVEFVWIPSHVASREMKPLTMLPPTASHPQTPPRHS